MGMENANFLVVEDSPTMRQLISFSLKRFKNAKIIEAVDGVDALKKLSGPEKIDLILTDINMPVMDGIEFIKNVRATGQHNSLPILILTTETSQDKRDQGKAAGGTGWIVKPFDPEKLISVIHRVVH